MGLGTLVLVETLNKVFWDSASNPPKTGIKLEGVNNGQSYRNIKSTGNVKVSD